VGDRRVWIQPEERPFTPNMQNVRLARVQELELENWDEMPCKYFQTSFYAIKLTFFAVETAMQRCWDRRNIFGSLMFRRNGDRFERIPAEEMSINPEMQAEWDRKVEALRKVLMDDEEDVIDGMY
jgi:hypothetical protein